MKSWKSSTLVVAVAFGVSVVLLFAKADMMRERASAGRPLITNHIYSPAAADPDLRNRERAERMTRPPEKSQAVIVRQPEGALATPTKATATTSSPAVAKTAQTVAAQAPTSGYRPPASHRYYVVAATFDAREKAERGLADLQRRGLKESFIGVFDDGKYVSVIARAFEREDQARIMLGELDAKHGIAGYIFHKTDE